MLSKYIRAILFKSFSSEDAFRFMVTSLVTSLTMLLFAVIKRILLDVKTAREKLFISLGLNLVIIGIETVGVLTYKLITNGYV